MFLDRVRCIERYKIIKKYFYWFVIFFLQIRTFLYKFEFFRDLGFDVDTDLSLNNNCTNVDVQNTQVFRRQEEQLNKRSDSTQQIYEQNEKE